MLDTEKPDKYWFPISDYIHRKNISISTIRRWIKQKKVPCTKINGKYYLYDENLKDISNSTQKLTEENQQLRKELTKCLDEIHELKMLIKIYETPSFQNKFFPSSPSHT